MSFLAGVIEGFYGQPWSQVDRVALFSRMDSWGLNTYLYAPKDDLKHRALWREPYSESEQAQIGQLIAACRQRNLHFIYALSPGLDFQYGRDADLGHLHSRIEQMLGIGCEHFALLFDDIPDRHDALDLERWGSPASAQCEVSNALFTWTRARAPRSRPAGRFLFCPTPYCGRMAEAGLGGDGYLPTVGRELLPDVDILWTGPEIVSREITVAHVRELQGVLRRKPMIWDNLHANDYDGRRFFCGPYSGRPPELRHEVSGLLSNPNSECPLNYVPLRTLAAYVRSEGTWDPRGAYLSAMREWLPDFATVGRPVALDDLILFGDCYYLPHGEGPEAETLHDRARRVMTATPAEWTDAAEPLLDQIARLQAFCVSLTELRDRPLFHALSRRVWELREELDVLERYLASGGRQEILRSGPHRGGLVRRLRRLRSSGATEHEPTVWHGEHEGHKEH